MSLNQAYFAPGWVCGQCKFPEVELLGLRACTFSILMELAKSSSIKVKFFTNPPTIIRPVPSHHCYQTIFSLTIQKMKNGISLEDLLKIKSHPISSPHIHLKLRFRCPYNKIQTCDWLTLFLIAPQVLHPAPSQTKLQLPWPWFVPGILRVLFCLRVLTCALFASRNVLSSALPGPAPSGLRDLWVPWL